MKNVTERCDRWVFDKTDDYTIVQEWSITCIDNQWKLAFVGTSHFAGIVLGSAAAGVLADKYDRFALSLFRHTINIIKIIILFIQLWTKKHLRAVDFIHGVYGYWPSYCNQLHNIRDIRPIECRRDVQCVSTGIHHGRRNGRTEKT